MIEDPNQMNKEINIFYSNLFKQKNSKRECINLFWYNQKKTERER